LGEGPIKLSVKDLDQLEHEFSVKVTDFFNLPDRYANFELVSSSDTGGDDDESFYSDSYASESEKGLAFKKPDEQTVIVVEDPFENM